MKRIFCITLLSVFSLINVNSQERSIILTINHMLNEDAFALNKKSENNIDQSFEYTRLEYYLSGFSIIHDGGQEKIIEDSWALIDASDGVFSQIDLGMHDIQNIEELVFYIGVDPDHNHLDPASWPMGHPLAPQAPSMHWGWASGYRFVALEGWGGTSSNQLFQLHGLGDQNYLETRLVVNPREIADEISIELNANYVEALANIRLNNGMIVHSEEEEAQLVISNFKRLVFSDASMSTSISNDLLNQELGMFPNPVSDGILYVLSDENNILDYKIFNGRGQSMAQGKVLDKSIELRNLTPGIYYISLKNGHTPIGHIKKIIVH